MEQKDLRSIPVVILCGGKGMRLAAHTQNAPKALVEIGQYPILWHVMRLYTHHGFRRFILCLGHLGDQIKRFFVDGDQADQGDITLKQPDLRQDVIPATDCSDLEITFAETGEDTNTGGRLKRVEQYMGSGHFLATYVDGLFDLNPIRLLEFHKSHGKLATLTAVKPTSPFGILRLGDNGLVEQFREKPRLDMWINGGFFVFERDVFDWIGENDDLERNTFVRFAEAGQIMAFRHEGYWACMDTYKDTVILSDLWENGQAPWRIWE